MDDVAVSLICDVVDNFDGEIETFFGNENNFDLVAIAEVSCCFVRRNSTRIQNYFERTVPSYFGDEFTAHFRMTSVQIVLNSLAILLKISFFVCLPFPNSCFCFSQQDISSFIS